MSDAAFKLTPELALDIIKRRRWVILVPLSIALALGIVLDFTLPKIYEAKTLILVESPQVPRNYVQPIFTEDTAQRINLISQQILSRTNLEKIIKNFDLFPKNGHGRLYNDFDLFSDSNEGPLYMEDKVANLRKRISIDVMSNGRQTQAFTISFKGQDPKVIASVANGLATSFIDANLKSRESQAIGTSSFLESELDSMRQKLERVEENIKNYRQAHMGELPEQLDTNLSILNRLQNDLNDRQKDLRDARLRLAELNTQATTTKEPSVVVIGGAQRPDEGTASLEDLKSQLKAMQTRYTDAFPDVQRLKRQIAKLEAAKAKEDRNDASDVSSDIPMALRRQIADAQRGIEASEADIKNLRAQIAQYQKRIEDIPKREQDLQSLKRDYSNIKATYDSLLNRKLEADIAVNLERMQKGEQFRVVDPAQVPKRPVAPNLKKILLLVIAGGLGAGAGLALLPEFARPTFRKADEIEARYGLPVLVTIPRLLQPRHIFWGKLNNIATVAYSIFIFGLFCYLGIVTVAGTDVSVNAFHRLVGS